jgi:protein O-GlcNAc transferase
MAEADLLNAAVAAHQAGQLPRAEQLYRAVLGTQPRNNHALFLLAILAQQLGRRDESIELTRRAIAVDPNVPDYPAHLAPLLLAMGDYPSAIDTYQQLIRLRPDAVEAYANLGGALFLCGRHDEAVVALNTFLAVHPNVPEAWNTLGTALKDSGHPERAIEPLRRAVQLRPDFVEVWAALGGACYLTARISDAVECHRKLVALHAGPRYEGALLHALYFDPAATPKSIAEHHAVWNARHAEHLAPANMPIRDPDSDRRLRIGYVSADFFLQASSLFSLPLLRNYDHSAFEIFCYASIAKPDDLTMLHQQACDVWRDITKLDDEQAASMIRSDEIDILVDLTLHAVGGRPLLFARKPAPIQISWLGYPGITGLQTIDYRLSDSFLDPEPDKSVWRLLGSFWCYDPLVEEPAPNESPARREGFVTFGSLNNFSKANDKTLDLWAEVLRSNPTSRFVMFVPDPDSHARVRGAFADRQVNPSRLTFVGREPRTGYLTNFHKIDIALDTWPYPGGTTTFDALWMGVPVVTMMGSTSVSRAGASILSNLGFAEWVTESSAGYLAAATRLATDVNQLANLRASLRDRLRASRLMDGHQFARDMEAIYRDMWRRKITPSPA